METLARCLKIKARSSGGTADPAVRNDRQIGNRESDGPRLGYGKAGKVAGVGEADFGPLLCVAQARVCLARRVGLAPEANIGL
jgi:hypothetical protein